ncbi:thioredoxin domain-containing protein [Streptomyces sp. NPDC048002]|uniref:DsbA family protein n=1 Tax=Streptomyces sp. NPDC048002 TaxID=3154344 RepID=UPI0033EBEA8C
MSAVVVLMLAACGQQHQQQPGEELKLPFGSAEELPEKLAADGTTIVVGDPDAKVSVRVYEDPRCPYCQEFETTGGGPSLREAMLDRQARAEYTLASFLDDRHGSGSKNAVNALRAALEEGKFVEFHEVLYAKAPEESVDGFSTGYLLELADDVEGLRGPRFDKAVTSMKYRAFVTASEKAYERAGGAEDPEGPGTPTVEVNDKRIPQEYAALYYERATFAQLLQKIHTRPWEWEQTEL